MNKNNTFNRNENLNEDEYVNLIEINLKKILDRIYFFSIKDLYNLALKILMI